MNELKIACPSCGGHIEFPVDMHGQVIPCPHCSLSVALQVPVRVADVPAKKSKNIGCLATVLILGAAVLLFIVIPFGMVSDHNSSQSDHNSSQSANDEAHQAYFAGYMFCKRYAPSGKNFTTQSGADVLDGAAKYDADNKAWLFFGYVDCQNRFGAMRHQLWFAAVKWTGSWSLDHLEIGSETIYDHDDMIR